MNLEKFTERSREFIQAAQAAALAAEHQRILPQHLLKVILEDEQDFAKNLLKKIGVDSHKILVEIETACNSARSALQELRVIASSMLENFF